MKPRVKIVAKSVAKSFAMPNERIIEVSAGTNGAGALISVMYDPASDSLCVEVYRAERVTVRCGSGTAVGP